MITKFLARDLTIEVSTGAGVDLIEGTTDDTWAAIGGLITLAHAPSTERADAGDFDSNGRAEHVPVMRGDSWTLSGRAKEDVADGTRDAGQLACEDLAKLTGLDAFGFFRITSPGGNAEIFQGSVEVTKPGGGHNELATWAVKVEVTGEPTYIPAAP